MFLSFRQGQTNKSSELRRLTRGAGQEAGSIVVPNDGATGSEEREDSRYPVPALQVDYLVYRMSGFAIRDGFARV